MTTETTSALSLQYEGSVKRVWQPPDPDQLWFEFTDDYSVFDWGKMPDTIANKGRALTVLGAWFFEKLAENDFWRKLADNRHLSGFDSKFVSYLIATDSFRDLVQHGCQSHYVGLVDDQGTKLTLEQAARKSEKVFMAVKKAQVLRPSAHVLLNQTVFSYPQKNDYGNCRLVPLEVVFRFGMPAGSSLKGRLERDPSYAGTLGLSKVPSEGELFSRPVIELYTKLEPKDRLLSVQEALLLSGLTPEQMKDLGDTACSLALSLFCLFAESGVELWDGKFEFVLNQGKLMLADSIGPDELRILYKGCHLSKELIRQVYRGSAWEKSLKTAQALASQRNSLDWKNICSSELGQMPDPFSPKVRNVVDKLYGTLTNQLAGKPLFDGQPGLEEFARAARELESIKSGI